MIFLDIKQKAVTLHRNSEREFLIIRLGYGVMVTLQILVLPFLVRVRVSQQKSLLTTASFFVCTPLS